MAEIFIVRRWVRTALWVVFVVGFLFGGMALFEYKNIVFNGDDARYKLALILAVVMFVVVALLALLYFVSPFVFDRKRPRRGAPYRSAFMPSWVIGLLVLLLVVFGGGYFIYSHTEKNIAPIELLRQGQFEQLIPLLDQNPSLVNSCEDGSCMLIDALKRGDSDAVELLLGYNVDLSVKDESGRSVAICSLVDKSLLSLVLKHGVTVDDLDFNGYAAIHYATAMGDVDSVNLLLDAGASVNLRTTDYMDPILLAAGSGDLDMVKLLYERGANINSCDLRENTALHMAVIAQDVDLIVFLLENGAKPVVLNRGGLSAVHIAARTGNIELVKLFEDYVKVERVENRAGYSVFDMAILRQKFEVAEYLLEQGVDINRKRKSRNTLLHELLLDEDYRAVEFLIKHGADIDLRGSMGKTARELMAEKKLKTALDLDREINGEPSELDVDKDNKQEGRVVIFPEFEDLN